MEEIIFRLGTGSLLEGVWRSVLFGLFHCLLGIPLSAGLAMTIPGMWFTWQYLEYGGGQYGVHLATIHHLTYDLVVLVAAFIAYLFCFFREMKSSEPDSLSQLRPTFAVLIGISISFFCLLKAVLAARANSDSFSFWMVAVPISMIIGILIATLAHLFNKRAEAADRKHLSWP